MSVTVEGNLKKGSLKKLKVGERTVLELLSVFYLPTGQTTVSKALEKLKYKGDVKADLESLEAAGWVVRPRSTAFRVHPEWVEHVSLEASRAGRFADLRRAMPAKGSLISALEEYPEGVRDLRILYYSNDKLEFCRKLAELAKRFPLQYDQDPPLNTLAQGHRDGGWLADADPTLRNLVIQGVMLRGTQSFQIPATVLDWLDSHRKSEQPDLFLLKLYWQHRFLADEGDKARKAVNGVAGLEAIVGWSDMENGKTKQAVAQFEKALVVAQRETTGKARLTGWPGFLMAVAYIREGQEKEAKAYLEGLKGLDFSGLKWLQVVRRDGGVAEPAFLAGLKSRDPATDGHDSVGAFLCLYWGGLFDELIQMRSRVEKVLERANDCGQKWVSRQLEALLERLDGEKPKRSKKVALVDILAPDEAWRRSVDALMHLAQQARPVTDERVAWRIEEADGQYSVRPLLQKRSKRGDWTQGREILPARLLSNHNDCLIEEDRRALRTLVHGLDSYRVGDEGTLAELVGHPYVFREENPNARVEVQTGSPELRVLKEGEELVVDVQPVLPYFSADVGVIPEGVHRLRVYRVTEAQREIARVIGKGLRIPVESNDILRRTVEAMSPLIGVQSDFSGTFEGVREVDPDSRPHLFLFPYDDGLRLEFRVRPLGEEGPTLVPNKGGRQVLAELKNGRVQARRDLEKELELAVEVLNACPNVTRFGPGGFNHLVPHPADCLEILEELAELPEGVLSVHWPEGKTMNVRRPAGELVMSVKKDRDWFAVDGKLKVDEDLVLDIKELMEKMQTAHGRFLELGEGKFLALTEKFRQKLEHLNDIGYGFNGGVRVDALAASMAFGDDPEIEGDKHWKARLNSLQEVRGYRPALPSTLQADLRDYQMEGFRWLSRLAKMGTGACLADDMGLGKTLQAISVILQRASEGPTLVIAPTSVCPNWFAEVRKFAPTLQPVLFADSEREEVVKGLGPYDVLITSYGLVTRENELLMSRDWTTMVIDEAQAIKNYRTKRFEAVAAIPAGFKIATTGTPIENNLDELWALFRFLNPGLLGQRERFSQRFSQKIEANDKDARNRLRLMVRPFILRRLKREVLDELPPRTEVTLHIDLSDDEKALYENLRRQALEQIEKDEKNTQPLAVLAELTKLRRLCCHPYLVAPDESITPSKLEAFSNLVQELLEGDHKALVFSQFVDVLKLLEAELKELGVSYQYLDGSTPAKERANRVAAFQRGEGDIFLISLKAGGTGLNLTAADYVIHFDPWWNPAVEDQASDRAYRIGQTRPVTVYRLVAQGTVEERIIALHKEKRDLADSLLEGSDQVGRLTSEDLVGLLRESALPGS